jgi:uncharacterized membrane protein YphA (DoxX/SURF4 family)
VLPEALREKQPQDRLIDWVLRVAVAVCFLFIGLGKFSSDPHSDWPGIFQRIGFGVWFRYATGIIEATGGLLYLIPRATRIGAVLLVGTMAGAIVAHIWKLGDPVSSVIPLGLLIGVIVIALRVAPEDAATRTRPMPEPRRLP